MAKNREKYLEGLRRGRAYNDRGAWQQAFDAFRVAIREFPRQPAPYAGLGEACFGLNRLDRALESYKLAARYSRGDIKYLQRVADLQERLGQLSEAARTYMAAGEIHLKSRRLHEAMANWERAVRLEPALLGAHRRLAMVNQRQGHVKGAVREYLAIARILQMRGEQQKALQMCQAALRLDPGSDDAIMAMELVQHGEEAFRDDLPLPEGESIQPEEAEDEMAATVRQIATIFEEERKSWEASQITEKVSDPVARAARRAQDELAEEIFREDEEDIVYRGAGLTKLERDALIGQGMDFQARGEVALALQFYQKAVDGGLHLSAAYFTLGLLHLEQGDVEGARQVFARAAKDPSYHKAIKTAMQRVRGA